MPEKLTAAAKIAIRVAAAGLGAAAGGPLGCALGVVAGDMSSGPFGDLVQALAKESGKKATEKLFDTGGDSLVERVKKYGGNLEDAYREALRLSLPEVRLQIGSGFEEWFDNWALCLESKTALKLEELHVDQLSQAQMDSVLKRTMVRIDAQGAMMRKKPSSIILNEREMPEALEAGLVRWLPELFNERFQVLIVSEPYEAAWKKARQQFEEFVSGALASIQADTRMLVSGVALSNEKLDQLLAMTVRHAEEEQRISKAEARAARAESESEEWKRRYLELAEADPPLEELLVQGDLESAARAKTGQLQRQEAEQARTYFELGTIHELRFDWAKALEAYREAWRREPSFEYGALYAYFAQKQNHFQEAITAYETLRPMSPDRAATAMMLNNLAALYSATQRMREAKDAYNEALTAYLELARIDAGAYLPYVATTRSNLAALFSDMQRTQDAEKGYGEALSTYRELARINPQVHLPDVARTLNNLAALYSSTQRMREAEEGYDEALSIRRELARSSPEAYLPDVAATLNNLAILYRASQRMREAEEVCAESLSIYRELAGSNPEAYRPYVARTLNNMANLYSATQRMQKAEAAYREALLIRRELARTAPEVYLPDVGKTLSNLANLYSGTQRMSEAEAAYNEAYSIYLELADKNPEAYLPDAVVMLNNLAIFYSDTQRMREAEECYGELLSIRRELAQTDPETYLPDVAMSLHDLAILYSTTQRNKEALGLCREADVVLRPLWRDNPQRHGDLMARILWMMAVLVGDEGSVAEVYEIAQEAFAMANAPDIRAGIQKSMDRLQRI